MTQPNETVFLVWDIGDYYTDVLLGVYTTSEDACAAMLAELGKEGYIAVEDLPSEGLRSWSPRNESTGNLNIDYEVQEWKVQ